MATPSNLKLRVEQQPGPKLSIARLATARTAFVGRTLRGPVGRPMIIKSFAEFQHTFGGLWQPAPLGYAVEQFFDNGGREALIVRVVNGARANSDGDDGDDGAPICDYDLIGSDVEGTGIFALSDVDYFNFLCIPPLSREKDLASSVLLVAERFCARRRALLIVDPPAHWHTADDALRGLKDWELKSENALMYFPHILAHDKLRDCIEAFAPCGAVAGMLARSDEMFPLSDAKRNEEAVPRPGYRPTCIVSDDRRKKLAMWGVNTIQAVRSAARVALSPRTLAAGHAGSADGQYLSARRLALFIVNCIERGTRWAANAPARSVIGEVVAERVRVFFEDLFVAGAFGTRRVEEAFFVVADERARAQGSLAAEFQFLIGFAATHGNGLHSFRITHGPSGTKVQPVSTNRLNFAADSPAELHWVERI